MKNLKTIMGIAIMAVLTACGGTQNTASSTQQNNRGRSNTQMETSAGRAPTQSSATRTTTTTTRQTSTSRTATVADNAKIEAAREANMQKMYKDLQMDKAQIARYEKAWNTEMSTWKKNNPNQAMNAYVRAEKQDKIMRELLNEQQLENYQQWAREHANTFGE